MSDRLKTLINGLILLALTLFILLELGSLVRFLISR